MATVFNPGNPTTGLDKSRPQSSERHLGQRKGAIYSAISTVAGGSTGAVTNDRIYLSPLFLPSFKIDRFFLDVTVAAVGNARFGIYSNNNGIPDVLLFDAGIADTNIVGDAALDLAVPYVLPDDYCWIATIFNSTPTVRIGTADNSWIIGMATMSSGSRGLYQSAAYGPLPKRITSIDASTSTAPMVGLMWK